MTDTLKLENLIRESGLKKGYLADMLGLSRFGFMKKVNNLSEFKASEIIKLCELLEIRSMQERESIFFKR